MDTIHLDTCARMQLTLTLSVSRRHATEATQVRLNSPWIFFSEIAIVIDPIDDPGVMYWYF